MDVADRGDSTKAGHLDSSLPIHQRPVHSLG
jgi:hypothetical protein